jgi:hypothetical protein
LPHFLKAKRVRILRYAENASFAGSLGGAAAPPYRSSSQDAPSSLSANCYALPSVRYFGHICSGRRLVLAYAVLHGMIEKMRKCLICTTAALLAAGLPFSSAQAQTNQLIYSNSLAEWLAELELGNQQFKLHKPSADGLHRFDQRQLFELYGALCRAFRISIRPCSRTSLLAQRRDPSGGQVLTIEATLGGTATTSTVNVGPLAAGNTWQQFTVSLAAWARRPSRIWTASGFSTTAATPAESNQFHRRRCRPIATRSAR